jgi:hypothetical protein
MAIQPWQIAADITRVWVPFISAITVVWRVYAGAKNSVNEWAHKLLDNHLHHVQESLTNIDRAQSEQIELLKKIANK